MILRARFVITMDGSPIEDGAVAVAGTRIVDVGPITEVRARNPGKITDLGEVALLPGLINAHCHFDYTCLRNRIPPPQNSFTDWIRSINAAKANLSVGDYIASINEGFVEAKRFGTVAVANLTAFADLIPRVQPLVRTAWFVELIDVRHPVAANGMVDGAVELLKATDHSGLSPHAPFTASTQLYGKCVAVARARGMRLTTHLAESRDEMSMFRDRSGPLFEFMQSIGRDMSDCGAQTPLAHFLSGPASDQPWLIAHLNELTESDFDLLEASSPRFQIVHCPRSHRYFGHTPFPFARLRALGFGISLGTDSLASNADLNMFGEMRQFRSTFSDVPPGEILAMATRNGATALGRSEELGRVAKNYLAELVAVPFDGSQEDLLEAIVSFEGKPRLDFSG
jgi:cytosine/adenosine deaminase-related metal-dependent hydrolase